MNWPLVRFAESSPVHSGGAPASTPASSPPEGGGTEGAAPAPDAGGSDAFAGMENDDFDLVEMPTEEAPTGGEPGGAEPPQEVKPPSQPAAEPKAPPQQPAAAQPQAAPAKDVPSAPRSSLEQAIEGFRTNHNELSQWASTNLFALSKDDADILETDAAGFIPVLRGRVYSQALQATVNLMKNFVPEMINQGVMSTNARTAKANEALQEFYAANPGLSPQQHGALVDKWARAFRAANPQASRSDAIKFVGNAVNAELGLPPTAGGNGARPPARSAPFAPARPGVRSQTPPRQQDPYEGMDMDFDQE